MVFRRGKPGTHAAWWLVPIGVLFVALGIGVLSTSDGNLGWKSMLFGGALVVIGVVFGIRGERFR